VRFAAVLLGVEKGQDQLRGEGEDSRLPQRLSLRVTTAGPSVQLAGSNARLTERLIGLPLHVECAAWHDRKERYGAVIVGPGRLPPRRDWPDDHSASPNQQKEPDMPGRNGGLHSPAPTSVTLAQTCRIGTYDPTAPLQQSPSVRVNHMAPIWTELGVDGSCKTPKASSSVMDCLRISRQTE